MATDALREALHETPPLFIIGSPRSGTTVLTRMANRFLDIHVARDAGLFLRFAGLLPSYGDLREPARMARLVHDLYGDFLFARRFRERGLELSEKQLIARLPDATFGALVREVFVATAETHGKRRWGNKKPSYSLNVDEVDDLFPGARFLHIIRDGHDVVLSMRNASHLLVEKNWYFAARDWVEHVEGGRLLRGRLGSERYLEVRYEDFLRSPVATFQSMLQFVGANAAEVEEVSRKEPQIRERLKAGNFNKWRSAMPAGGVRTVERVAGPLLAELGYDLAYPAESGRPISRSALLLFRLDRFVRNNASRNMRNVKKVVNYRLNDLRTWARARQARVARAGRRVDG